jgi:hypothetical protein
MQEPLDWYPAPIPWSGSARAKTPPQAASGGTWILLARWYAGLVDAAAQESITGFF